MIVWLDVETYCELPISLGTHRYAERAEVMLAQFAIDDGPVEVRDLTAGDPFPLDEVLGADLIVAHNAAFERTVLRHAGGIELPLERLHCTMAQALSHALPAGLGALCDVLKVPTDKAKDKAGKELIHLFCKPRPKNHKLRRATRETHPEEWARFVDYARLDIEATRAVYRKLPRWNYPNARERAVWQWDQLVNERGFAVDLELVDAAIAATARRKLELAGQVAEATDGAVASATQRDALLAYLLDEHGVDLPDMRADTLERRLEDPELPQPVRDLLLARLDATTTSTAKYPRIRAAVSSDGRMRGTIRYAGAGRTRRFAGRIIQPQNLPRPTIKGAALELGIEALKLDCAELAGFDVMPLASSALRGVIVAGRGRELYVSDLANIEGRMLAALAGEQWKLDAFVAYDEGRGPDIYKATAGELLDKAPELVDDDERQGYGKVPELACGYQGAAGAFESMARVYGVDIDEPRALAIVKAWRAKHPNTVALWYGLDAAARQAILEPGVDFPVGVLTFHRVGQWLTLRLPTGCVLCYPGPAIVNERCRDCRGSGTVLRPAPDGELALVKVKCRRCNGHGSRSVIQYWGVDQYTRKWKRQTTYGGKLTENADQSLSREVMTDGAARAEAAGFETVLHVHDELVTESRPGRDPAELSACLAVRPWWLPQLPLAAKGFSTMRYRKD